MSVTEGWYDDPSAPHQWRYWDGVAWTQHVAPKGLGAQQPAPATDLGPSSALHYLVPVGRSAESIWAPYLGLLSLIPIPLVGALFGAGGILLGALALRKAKRGGHGSGRAWVAIVLGSVGLVINIVLMVALFTGQLTDD